MNTTTHLISFVLFSIFLFSSFLLIISPYSLVAATFLCNPNDYKVLLKIKKSLYPPFPSWVPNTDCCEWYGVECDSKTNRTNTLDIFSGELSGQIPSEVGDLPYLENLLFQDLSNITGSIPQSISKLKNLKKLHLSRLNLSGPVPNFLNQLTNLAMLDLSFNQLSGLIPPNLADLKNLIILHLSFNQLTGSIPESFGRFTGFTPQLLLSGNQLSGKIPKSLGDIDFFMLDLSRNKLEGDASMLFNPKHTYMSKIDLSRNQLKFNLTKVNKLPPILDVLDLNHNNIGKIPVEMKGFHFLNVSYNRLCGEIPSGGNLQGFDNTSFFIIGVCVGHH